MTIVGLIPARAGSKGIPGKNTMSLGGKPLIAWTIEAALASRTVDRVIVSTEDEATAQVAARFGAEVPELRSRMLARDDTPTMDVVLDLLCRLPEAEAIVLLQPTSPLRTATDIDTAVAIWRTRKTAVVSVTHADPPPAHMLIERPGGVRPLLQGLPSGARRQDLAPVWALNGAIYVASPHWLRSHRTFVTEKTGLYRMPKERSVDIDDAIDAALAEVLLCPRPPLAMAA